MDAEDNDIDVGFGFDGSVIHSSPEFRHRPHMTVVIKLREKQGDELRIGCDVMLDPEEVETEAQAKKAGRLVDLEEMVKMLRFSTVSGVKEVVEA